MAEPALLLRIPGAGPEGLATWAFWNAQDEEDVRSLIQQFGKGNLPSYVLDPMNTTDPTGWLVTHQQSHNDKNAALGLVGANLLDLDWSNKAQVDSWIFLNFMDHSAWHLAIGK